ncbi:quinone oxidoreductase [Sphaerisporangium siamense]|uniref:NADPH2:quinone reductase n=1 Tax=Sphaerisporangium siamense TaxID=795645 RepID=A0A7W7DAC8_9ACTN|nr:quinone oxidoreductase [Sphaerisporangium siamense]MBB4701946.1 NADPH2:quinone reductase [Sphaerisporangium siamense]GII84141.1 quinone oxidoreductase [Sphaerisporangium siamense]
MHAIVVTTPGGSDALDYAEVPDPVPGAGEVLVDVAAAGVNFIDVYRREGRYPIKTPFVLGSEGAGTVTAVGPDVRGVAIGDRVGWCDGLGGYAEKVVVPAERTIPLPDGVDFERAAAVLLQGLTAHYLTHSVHAVSPGDDVLVHAAAGGMGLLLTQMAKLRGGRVIGTVSTDEKQKLAREAGADDVIRYENFDKKVRGLTGGRGVRVVYDGVGAATFDGSLASLGVRGMMALYGAASGPVPPFDPQRLNAAGSLFLTRPTLAHYTVTREELLGRAADVLGWVESGRLHVHISHRYPLARVRQAHEDLEGRRTTGKLLLIP